MNTPIFPEHVLSSLLEIEESGSPRSSQEGLNSIRHLGLEDFGLVLWNMPKYSFPGLSSVLPKMASDEVTTLWTGAAGLPLLEQSVSFVRACAAGYADARGHSLRDQRILDFGCGYGRFLRLFQYYTDDIVGVDPWDRSIEECQAAGLSDKVRLSQAVPENMPFEGTFDFIFAFSVFTHLSRRSTLACLGALRTAAYPGTILMLTIRPVEFWDLAAKGGTHIPANPQKMEELRKNHRELGFAFYLNGSTDEKEIEGNYGDTSLSIGWLLDNSPGWELVGVDRTLADPYQRYVMLRAI